MNVNFQIIFRMTILCRQKLAKMEKIQIVFIVSFTVVVLFNMEKILKCLETEQCCAKSLFTINYEYIHILKQISSI